MRISARVNIELDKPANYILLGFWNATTDYYISDLGIPFVKRPDGSTLGYSVYALNVQQSTKGSWITSEWRLVESAEFIYMQQAYIERLQAAIVTSEMIESIMIRTKNLEVKDEAKVGGFTIDGGRLVAQYSYYTYVGSSYVQVSGEIRLSTGGLTFIARYGGTVDHPPVVEWSTELTASGVKVGNMEVRRDGIYRNGTLIL